MALPLCFATIIAYRLAACWLATQCPHHPNPTQRAASIGGAIWLIMATAITTAATHLLPQSPLASNLLTALLISWPAGLSAQELLSRRSPP